MTAHNPDEFQWANTFWECFERSHKNGLLEIMRSIIRSAVSVAVEDMTRFRDNAVEDMAMWMERAGKLAGGVDVATLIREAVNEERERCARICEEFPDNLMAKHIAQRIRGGK